MFSSCIEAKDIIAEAVNLKRLYIAIAEALRPGNASIKYVDIQLDINNVPNPTTIKTKKNFFLKKCYIYKREKQYEHPSESTIRRLNEKLELTQNQAKHKTILPNEHPSPRERNTRPILEMERLNFEEKVLGIRIL
ncbi:18929_t:CDS:2 [Racocetra fulgida]|uniref:18929_t:CDS:1 n=1 Tax=Racocetra fulgida TaxID=60492 RepID=A0A9N9E2L9_9GLOM|nr:18929_t:CDS:2 [Racocetra fulgida]